MLLIMGLYSQYISKITSNFTTLFIFLQYKKDKKDFYTLNSTIWMDWHEKNYGSNRVMKVSCDSMVLKKNLDI
jgi:hypothetical protein